MDSEVEIIIKQEDLDQNNVQDFFNKLNTCFIEYKLEFNCLPDTIYIQGLKIKPIYDSVENIFSGVYEIIWKDHYDNLIIFKNSSISNKKIIKNHGYARGDDLSGRIVNGVPNFDTIIQQTTSSLCFSTEKDEKTELVFNVNII